MEITKAANNSSFSPVAGHMDTDGYSPSTSIFTPEPGKTVVNIGSFQEFLKFFREKYVYRCLLLM